LLYHLWPLLLLEQLPKMGSPLYNDLQLSLGMRKMT
jgi:hypothetical protein